ncbi:MAG: ABC transporter permease [Gordonia sp. (in: high G+C Gram-positive bacteria)]
MRSRLGAQRWWIMRVLALPVHLLAFAIAAFFLVAAIPGDPVVALTGGQVTKANYAAIQHSLGLDQGLFSQLLHFLNNLLHLDFGTSIASGRSVASEFATRVPATVELALMGIVGVTVASLGGALLVITRPRNIISRLLRVYARTAGALPEYCLAVAGIFVFYATLHWAPAPLGRLSPTLAAPSPITHFPFLDALLSADGPVIASEAAHLALPVIVLVIANSPVVLRLLVHQLEVAVEDPATRFRAAAGASWLMVTVSMYRRALPGTVTMLGAVFGYLLGGAVVMEALFGLGGMGQYAVDSVNSADVVAMRSFLMVVAALSLTVFLLVDITNMVLDPRRRPGVRAGVA